MNYEIRDAVLTRKDVAGILRCAESTLARLIRVRAVPAPFRIGGRQCWCQYRLAAWLAMGCPADQPETSEIPRRVFRTADSIHPLLTAAEASGIPEAQKVRVSIGGLIRWVTHHSEEKRYAGR